MPRIFRVEKTVEKSLDPPLGHGFTGMLARNDPDCQPVRVRAPDGQQGVRSAIGRQAQCFCRHPLIFERGGNQLLMILLAVGRKVGVPDHIGLGPVLDDQLSVFKAGIDPVPVQPIRAGYGAVALEAFRIGDSGCVLDAQAAVDAGCPVELEIEPLQVAFANVRANPEADVVGTICGNDLDIAAIKR